MEKKIIGYKLIKPEMYKAASMILHGNEAGSYQLDRGINVEDNPDWIEKLTKAAVLDIWFEPIYEEVKLEFKAGDFVYISYKGGSYTTHGYMSNNYSNYAYNETIPDITRFVEIITLNGRDALVLEMNNKIYAYSYEGKYKEYVRKATDKEIDAYLFEEAKRRYPIGTKIHPVHLSSKRISVIYSHNSYHEESDNYITFANEGNNEWLPAVYCKGTNTWAEIVGEVPLVINGYTAKFHEDSVSFGCQNLTAEFIFRLVELTKNGISIHDMGGKDLREELIEIYERLKQ